MQDRLPVPAGTERTNVQYGPVPHFMKQIPLDIGLTPRPRLQGWVAGPNVRVLHQVREQICHMAGDRLPAPVPLYVWGPAGSGKTHLLQAVLQELQDMGLMAGWLDADTPCGGYPLEFDPRWSAIVLDNVDGYSAQQQHTAFNWFIHASTPREGAPRWVLAAGSQPVADLPLREDLRTRLGWGQAFALQPLAEEDVRKALQQAAVDRGLVLGDEVLHFMLSRFSRDLGSLNALLAMLDDYSLQTHRALTVPLLKQMLNDT